MCQWKYVRRSIMALERLLFEHYIGHGWTVKIYVLQSMLVMMVNVGGKVYRRNPSTWGDTTESWDVVG